MLSERFLEQVLSSVSCSLLLKINQKKLSGLIVEIFSAEEQKEIVCILG